MNLLKVKLTCVYRLSEWKNFAKETLCKYCRLLGKRDIFDYQYIFVMDAGVVSGYLNIWFHKTFLHVESPIIEETVGPPTDLTNKNPKPPEKVREIVRTINTQPTIEGKLEAIKRLLGESMYREVKKIVEEHGEVLNIVAEDEYNEVDMYSHTKFMWKVIICVRVLNVHVDAELMMPATLLSANMIRILFKKVPKIDKIILKAVEK